jgi:hypothetical protein
MHEYRRLAASRMQADRLDAAGPRVKDAGVISSLYSRDFRGLARDAPRSWQPVKSEVEGFHWEVKDTERSGDAVPTRVRCTRLRTVAPGKGRKSLGPLGSDRNAGEWVVKGLY